MNQRSEIADGMRIDWDVSIEMDDGVVLRADVFRPLSERPHPVIMTSGPYAKNLPFEQGWPWQWELLTTTWPEVVEGTTSKYNVWETADPEKWVPQGYACVRVDSRGASRSPGYLDPFSPRETRDYYDCIEWVARQTWCNGRVGLNGISYYGINCWHVAALQPPHLSAICVWEGAAEWYRDMNYHGGIPSTFWPWLALTQILRVQYGVGTRGPINMHTGELICGEETLSEEELEANRCDLAKDLRSHPLDGNYYADRSPDWAKVEVPLLSAANWGGQGLHPRGNFEGFIRSASQQKWLECHGFEHWTTFYTDYGREMQLRFFDHFLKDAGSWVEDQPPVSINVRHVGNNFVPRAESEWPLAGTVWTKLYLDPRKGALTEQAASQAETITYDALGEGVMFRAPVSEEDVEITGPVVAKIWVRSSTTDADLFLNLQLFDPEGKEIHFIAAVDPNAPVAFGWLRASHRKLDLDLSEEWRPYHAHDEMELLVPGDVYECDVEFWPTSIVVPAGYQLALSIRGRDYDHGSQVVPLGDQLASTTGATGFHGVEMRGCGPFLHNDQLQRPASMFGGEVTIHAGGATPSHVLLPVIPQDR